MRRARNRADNLVGRGAMHIRGDVGVAIERPGDHSVPEPLLHHLRVDARGEHQAGTGVPQVVEADPRHAGAVDDAPHRCQAGDEAARRLPVLLCCERWRFRASTVSSMLHA